MRLSSKLSYTIGASAELAQEAKSLINKGFRRVRFHNEFKDYVGSFLWHGLGCYAAAVAEAKKVKSFIWADDGYPLPDEVASAFDLIAFTEHVKCSPREGNSKQTPAMWQRCGAHVLREEIRLLKPDFVLALGKSANARHLEDHVLDPGVESRRQFGQVWRGNANVADRPVWLLVVPHPTYRGVASPVLADLKRALSSRGDR